MPSPHDTTAAASRASGGPHVRAVVPALAVLTIALRLPAFLSTRHLVFDDGTYGVSVVDMRHGLAPYRGVFSAQGPLHFSLLYAGDLLSFHSINGPRVTPMLAGVAATIAAWAIARRLLNPIAGLIAGVLVATSGSMIWTTGQVTGDGLASAVAVSAVWAALVYRDDPRTRRALVAGALMGAAIAVKPLILPAALPVGWWLWSRRRVDHLASAVGAAIAVWFASALPWGLSRVWEQSVKYNNGAGPRYAKVSQLRKLTSTLTSRDLLVVAALLLAIGTVLFNIWAASQAATPDAKPRPAALHRGDLAIVTVWTVVTALVLVLEPALYRNHLAVIVPPIALLAAIIIRTPRALAILLVVLAPFSVSHLRDILHPTGYRGTSAQLMRALEALPSDAQAISDEPGFVYRAGLYTPKLMNDASVKRIDQHLLTTAMLGKAATDPHVCAVVVWSTRFGRDLPGLPAALRGAGLEIAHTYGGVKALWLRPGCR